MVRHMSNTERSPMVKYRSVWVSDVHLGTPGCRADVLLKFLKQMETDYLYLLGDIFDMWAVKRRPFWPTEHNTVVQKILKKARHGTSVIYIPGNHDECFRQFDGMVFGDVKLVTQATHTTASGHKILCMHGDEHDIVTRYHRWVAVLGDIGYTFLLWVNRKTNLIRSKCGLGHWSLAAFVKRSVKQAVNFIGEFELSVVKHAAEAGVDAVMCGHIHHAEIRQRGDVTYMNTGDMVESCTAIVETESGEIQLLDLTTTPPTIITKHTFL